MRHLCLVAAIVGLITPSLAEKTDQTGWQYDATMPEHLSDGNPISADINAINGLMLNMIKCWNAHDLAGYMSAFWNSPELLLVLNNEQLMGWDATFASYKQDFPDPKSMGHAEEKRIQIRMTKPDLALARTEWAIVYPNSDAQVIGNTTLNLRKLGASWKVVSAYSSYVRSTPRGWEYDSIAPEHPATTQPADEEDIKAVNDLLLKMLDRWNAHDIDGYLSVLWNSPQLLVILQNEQYQGWQSLYKTYKDGFPNLDAMGYIEPSRIQIKLVRPDLANAVTWWTIRFQSSKIRAVGSTTMDLQKFADGWKIVLAHSSFIEP
jgi:hypothetical protein